MKIMALVVLLTLLAPTSMAMEIDSAETEGPTDTPCVHFNGSKVRVDQNACLYAARKVITTVQDALGS